MTSHFPNPWAEAILEQMWIVRQTTAMLARSVDLELLLDPQAMTDYCLNPTEKRLNPLEFHGKRRVRKGSTRDPATPGTTRRGMHEQTDAQAGRKRRAT
ncbi:MAG: hypothetical protein ABI696_05695 [Rubrivivax sp.]